MKSRASIATLAALVVFLGAGVLCVAEDDAVTAIKGDPRAMDAIDAWAAWLEHQLAVNGVPGASVAIVHDQELLFSTGFGLADPATGKRAAPDTLYSICSNSKLFTSIGVMQLRDAGKLRLDDRVADHLDWFDIDDVHPNDEPINIRGILTHSSGLPRESDYPYWSDPGFPFPTHDQIVDRLGEQATLYPSGRYFQYSNLGLTLAGEIVASSSGRSFDEYIRAEILDPLGMTDTFTDIPAEHHGNRMAVGHSARKRDGNRDALPIFQTRGIAPAAGFASTVEDLARFALWQFRLLGGGEDEVLRGATLREMHRVHWVDPDWETTWGLGFLVKRVGDATFVEHGGRCPGYTTQVTVEPDSKLGVIVLTNAIGAEVDLYVGRAFELIGPAIADVKADPEGAPEREPALDRYVGIYESIWGYAAVVRWGDGLATVGLGSRDPKQSMDTLVRDGDQVFRRVRKDDGTLGERVVFDVADDGVVTRMGRHSNWMAKVR